ncbi:peroxide stress protein YaaA [Teredinibacter franksiae]|uniref:peroxide stress protein YaaA n=1 Tax=Teredinibacter franksiae TaxID=2761453 RepID=UPI001628C816|nr:peroxide stress protein YaaA [Teredinibacter franksiae]
MLIVISPAKNLDYETPTPTKKHTKAALLDDASELMVGLKELSPQGVSSLMGISDKLGVLNYDRFQQWSLPFNASNARQAVLAFKGDVYVGLDAYSFDEQAFAFAQQHLRILSGLYGVLKPLDLMQPYRLEMGTSFANERGANLYQFWGDNIVLLLNKQLKKLGTQTLVNLASNEYFKSVDKTKLSASIITPVFKDWKNGQYKIISFFAKKARGRMSAYIIKNGITDPMKLKGFDWDGYRYNSAMSDGGELVFTRMQE